MPSFISEFFGTIDAYVDWLAEKYTTHPSNLIDMPDPRSPHEHSVGSGSDYGYSHDHVAEIEAMRNAQNGDDNYYSHWKG